MLRANAFRGLSAGAQDDEQLVPGPQGQICSLKDDFNSAFLGLLPSGEQI
jgi:hypothetical protein